MNIATDTVVVQFLADVKGLHQGLNKIRQEAEKTTRALSRSASGGVGSAELANQRSLLRLENQRVKTRESLLGLRREDAGAMRGLWVAQRTDIMRVRKG